MNVLIKATLAMGVLGVAMSGMAAQNAPVFSNSQPPAMNNAPMAVMQNTASITNNIDLYNPDSMRDSKPSAYNAPVMKRNLGKQYVCKNGQQATVLANNIDQIRLNVDGQVLLLNKAQYSAWRVVGVFHRPTQEQVDEAEYSTENGLNGGGTIWKQHKHQATLKYYDAEGNLVNNFCEAVN